MPRMQILNLPSDVIGEIVKDNFAIIIDGADDAEHFSPEVKRHLDSFAEQCGAKAWGAFEGRMEIGQ